MVDKEAIPTSIYSGNGLPKIPFTYNKDIPVSNDHLNLDQMVIQEAAKTSIDEALEGFLVYFKLKGTELFWVQRLLDPNSNEIIFTAGTDLNIKNASILHATLKASSLAASIFTGEAHKKYK